MKKFHFANLIQWKCGNDGEQFKYQESYSPICLNWHTYAVHHSNTPPQVPLKHKPAAAYIPTTEYNTTPPTPEYHPPTPEYHPPTPEYHPPTVPLRCAGHWIYLSSHEFSILYHSRQSWNGMNKGRVRPLVINLVCVSTVVVRLYWVIVVFLLIGADCVSCFSLH